jgi:hypothetical protein
MSDETSGWPSQERDRDFILGERGSDQLLPSLGSPRSTRGPRANRVQRGQLPRTSGPTLGAPDAINPAGSHGSNSLTG